MARIAVAGGGIVGCAVAWELSRRGAQVEVFDPRPLGGGATQASAGMLVPYLEAHDTGPLRDLGVRSAALYDDFIARVSADAVSNVEYRRNGSLQLAFEPEAAALFRQRAAGPVEWLDAHDVRRLEPAVSTSCLGGLLAAPHGYVVVSSLVEALGAAMSHHGARVHVGRGVAAVDAQPTRARVLFDDGTDGDYDRVILCAGSWTQRLGIEEAAAAAVRPVRGQLVRLRWTGDPLRHIVWGPGCYVVPWMDGTVLVGATMEEVGFDERTTAAGVRDLLDAVCDLLPDAWRATFVDTRAGLRPATPDNLPIVGPSPRFERLVYATGHFRNGIMLAPLTARLVADFVVDGRRDPVLELVSPARFT